MGSCQNSQEVIDFYNEFWFKQDPTSNTLKNENKDIYYKRLKHVTKTFSGFQKGWNTRYITDFGKSVRFYVRGNEFTRQLDYFVDCIEQERTENISSFAEALKTDMVMDKIRKDAARSLAAGYTEPLSTPVSTKEFRQPSIWKKFKKAIRSE